MANWYGAHIAPAATHEDSEALVLELWELLARPGPDGPVSYTHLTLPTNVAV